MSKSKDQIKEDFITIYTLKLAMFLQQKGHVIRSIMPNPRHTEFNCWIFETDDSLKKDIEEYSRRKSK